LKKRILILSALLCLGVGALLVWKYVIQKTKKNAEEVISSEALLVFETVDPVLAWNQLVSQSFWQSISQIPVLQNAENNLLYLDSLAGRSGILQKQLSGNQLAISLHATGKEEFDFLYVFAFKNLDDFSLLTDIEDKFKQSGTITTRNYSGIQIRELKTNKSGITLTYALIDNLLAVSFTSFLVEDAIRHAQNNDLITFGEFYSELYDEISHPEGIGILRIGSQGVSGIVERIASGEKNAFIEDFGKNNLSANLQMAFKQDSIIFDGNIFFEGRNKLSLQHINSPSINYFSELIPNRTATYFQYQLEDPFEVFTAFNSEFQFNDLIIGDIDAKLKQKGFQKYLTGHMAFLSLEKIANEPQDKILLLNTENPNVQLELLKRFGIGENQEVDAATLIDVHQGKEIFIIDTEEFPAHLFNGHFKGFGDSYITLIEGVIVMANSSKAVKLFIDDWKRGRTWGKTQDKKHLIQKLKSPSGFVLVFDIKRFWTNIEERSAPGWKSFFQRYGNEIKSFEKMVLQAEQSGSETKIQIKISHQELLSGISDAFVSLTENVSVPFDTKLVYGPHTIQNYIDNSIEVMLQDEDNRLFLLTAEGETVFSTELDGQIVSEVFQFDYYKNGKLQLVFATENKIYGIDRIGTALPGFPLLLPDESISHLNLLDYENDRSYRFFVGTQKGNLYLLDKFGEVLEGWNPKSIGSQLAIKPAHHRVAGIGDRMVVMESKGNIHFFNRRGEPEAGSPVQIRGELGSEYVLLERGTAKETQLVTVTKNGEVIKVNLLGEVTFRNQLLRPDRESQFYLVKDQKDGSYLFVIHEYNKITVLDADFKEIFSKSMRSEKLLFQYFSFGSEKNILVIVDPVQEFVFLYDLNGKPLNPIPISGSNKIQIEYSESNNECTIYAIGAGGFSTYILPM
jgi:hypothetical protein